jgi:hypothetical protein
MKVALICVARNEDNYIKEWVEYNKKLGFDHIYILQNFWQCDIEDPSVIKIDCNYNQPQCRAYEDFMRGYGHNYDWVAIFDCDEFLVLKKHKDIKEFLSDYPDLNGIGINWVLFGNNDLEKVEDGEYSVIKRFTKRQASINIHVKSIIRPSANFTIDIHAPRQAIIHDTHRNHINSPFNPNGSDEIAQLNHYFCKTQEEFQQKINRGRADGGDMRKMDEFYTTNFNEVEDLYAYNFFFNE